MSDKWASVPLGEVIRQRKNFIEIDDSVTYARCRVQSHARGVVLRDEITGSEIRTKKQQVCRSGEFLVAEIDAKVGGYGLVPPALDGAIVSSHYFLFEVDETRLDRAFLDWFSKTTTFFEQIAAQGSTNYAAIRPSHVLAYRLPLPPLEQQQEIVSRLNALAVPIGQLGDLHRAMANEVDALWSAALTACFRGGLLSGRGSDTADELLVRGANRHSGNEQSTANRAHPGSPTVFDEGPFDLPERWKWTTLGSVLTHLVDCVNDTPAFAEEVTGFLGLKSTNIRPYGLDLDQRWYVSKADFEHWNRRVTPLEGDIVLTREAPMGYACRIPRGLDVCLTQRLMLLRADSEIILPDLLLHFLNSSEFRRQVVELSRGLTTPHVRVQDAPRILLPLPPMSVQHELLSMLDDVQTRIRTVNDAVRENGLAIASLLPSILNGVIC